ncbi:MAG: methionyl-tRNA formyltransferase [Alphaproteobacteria bacterium]
MARPRLAFMGTAAFAVPTLCALADAGHDLAAVYTQPPRPAGRGHKTRQSPIHNEADRHGLAVRTPKTFKDDATLQGFAALGCDAAVVVAYGLILPAPVLRAPRLGCLNLHPSLLPRWRGPAPIQRTIEAGDKETAVTVIQMDEGVDTGPILLMKRVTVADDATSGSLHDELAAQGARLMVAALDGFTDGTLAPSPQAEDGATHAAKLTRGEGELDWQRTAVELERRVRAMSPRPGVFFDHGGKSIRVTAAELALAVTNGGTTPGTLIGPDFTVACGGGALRLTRVQKAGRAAMDGADFLRGARIEVGTVLGRP